MTKHEEHQAAYAAATEEAHQNYDLMPQDQLKSALLSIREILKHTFPTHKLVASAEVIYNLLEVKI